MHCSIPDATTWRTLLRDLLPNFCRTFHKRNCYETAIAITFIFLLSGCSEHDSLVVRSVADIEHARIGVTSGTTTAQLAYKRFPSATISEFADFGDVIGALKSNHIDVTFTTSEAARLTTLKNPDLAYIDSPLKEERTCAAVRQGNNSLRKQINSIIADISADGTLAEIGHRWFGGPPGQYTTKQYPVATSGQPLRVGVAATREPMSFVDAQGQIGGHDGELARLFATRLQRPVEFVNMRWDALIPALQSGRIDLILTGMSYTEERARRVDFTDDYYTNEIVLLTRQYEPTSTSPRASFWQRTGQSFYDNIIYDKRYLLLWHGVQITILLTLLATALGTVLGALVCAMRMSSATPPRLVAVGFIELMRGTPVLVLLMLIFYVVFASVDISPVLVAVIAFGLHFAAYAAEIFRTGIRSIDDGQREAGIAMGFSHVQTFVYIILPQTIQRILPVYKSEFISLMKMTSIVGYVAVHDLTKASDIIRSRTFDAFFPLIMTAILYFLLAWLLSRGLEYLERRTDPIRRRQQKA